MAKMNPEGGPAPPFEIGPHGPSDKHFNIYGPDQLLLTVDYDDVDHQAVDALAEAMVAHLNEHFQYQAVLDQISQRRYDQVLAVEEIDEL
jgi:hypothetical protein